MATIPGSGGTVLVFQIDSPLGSSAGNLATDFLNSVTNPPAVSDLANGEAESSIPGALNIIDSQGMTGTFSLAYGDQYTYLNTGLATVLNGSSVGGDTVLATGATTYNEAPGAGDNDVTFVDGTNVFQGSSVSGGGDTVSGGTGYDTIDIYGGSNTIFSGSGHTLINLFDTVAGDLVGMFAGNTTVNAFGVSDTIFASATGTVFGGTGSLLFVAQTDPTGLAATIVGATGSTTVFGDDGSSINYYDPSSAGTLTFVAGGGNETLAGAGSTENLFAGTGTDTFDINTVPGGGTIFVNDFGASDYVNFAGLSVADETSLLGTASTTDGTNLFVTLSDGTKVEFVGITSLSGHLV